jgi:hypothetical protein
MIFIIGGILNVFTSTALHNILSRQMTTLEFVGFFKCLSSIATSQQHFLLFLCSQGFVLILAAVFFLTNMRPYQSSLDCITPEIQTPVAVGQYQHGSAKWLSVQEKDEAFDSFVLEPNDTFIRGLIERGYEGVEFM